MKKCKCGKFRVAYYFFSGAMLCNLLALPGSTNFFGLILFFLVGFMSWVGMSNSGFLEEIATQFDEHFVDRIFNRNSYGMLFFVGLIMLPRNIALAGMFDIRADQVLDILASDLRFIFLGAGAYIARARLS